MERLRTTLSVLALLRKGCAEFEVIESIFLEPSSETGDDPCVVSSASESESLPDDDDEESACVGP